SEKRADENAALEESTSLRANGLEIFSVVPKRFPLSNRAFVVDLPDPPNERVVETYLSDRYSLLLGFSDLIPDPEVNLLRPPMVEGGNSQGRYVVPFHGVPIVWRRVRQLLHECEEVRSNSGSSELSKRRLRIFDKLVPVPLEAG